MAESDLTAARGLTVIGNLQATEVTRDPFLVTILRQDVEQSGSWWISPTCTPRLMIDLVRPARIVRRLSRQSTVYFALLCPHCLNLVVGT